MKNKKKSNGIQREMYQAKLWRPKRQKNSRTKTREILNPKKTSERNIWISI